MKICQAVASEGGTDDAKRRGDAFARAFSAHLARYLYTQIFNLFHMICMAFSCKKQKAVGWRSERWRCAFDDQQGWAVLAIIGQQNFPLCC